MDKNAKNAPIEIIAIGTSHGGFEALKSVLKPLPKDFCVPILVVRHQPPSTDGYIISALNDICQLDVSFAEDGVKPEAGHVYLAPPDRHMLIDGEGRIKLTNDPKVNFSRPAIDPLFASISTRFKQAALVIVLTGANNDGAMGAAQIKSQGGSVIVQDPASAEAPAMPTAVIEATEIDDIVWLDQIGPFIWTLCRGKC